MKFNLPHTPKIRLYILAYLTYHFFWEKLVVPKYGMLYYSWCSETGWKTSVPLITLQYLFINKSTYMAWEKFSSVWFTGSVMSNSLWPHEVQHARPPCPSPTPGVYPNSCPLVMPSNHLMLCRPLLLLPSIFPSIRVFSNESALSIRWSKYWSFRFSISLSNKHTRTEISFRMDWLDLLAVQGTLKSLLQHHCSKASILQCSAFFLVQLSHPYMTTGKTIALTRLTFVDKVMSLLFNMLSKLAIAFLPRSSIF